MVITGSNSLILVKLQHKHPCTVRATAALLVLGQTNKTHYVKGGITNDNASCKLLEFAGAN